MHLCMYKVIFAWFHIIRLLMLKINNHFIHAYDRMLCLHGLNQTKLPQRQTARSTTYLLPKDGSVPFVPTQGQQQAKLPDVSPRCPFQPEHQAGMLGYHYQSVLV